MIDIYNLQSPSNSLSCANDGAWIVCPYLMGTSGPATDAVTKAKHHHGLTAETVSNMSAAATKLLLEQSSITSQLAAVIPYEIGGAATASAVATAAWLDVPVIDAGLCRSLCARGRTDVACGLWSGFVPNCQLRCFWE